MMMKNNKTWAVLFDLDETLVLTSALEPLRKTRKWGKVYAGFPRTHLPDGTLEFLKELSEKAALGVVTKAPRTYAERLLSHHRIRLPVLVAFHDVTNLKPHPEALLLASQRLGIDASRCIYVGDDASDVQAARAAHFVPIGVSWGTKSEIEVLPICGSWDEVYDEILGLIE